MGQREGEGGEKAPKRVVMLSSRREELMNMTEDVRQSEWAWKQSPSKVRLGLCPSLAFTPGEPGLGLARYTPNALPTRSKHSARTRFSPCQHVLR